jgi:cation diffusion facilitator family transporter
VNLGCALLLKQAGHSHDEPHRDAGDGHHHDLNLRSAYMHVVADALTSVFAIVALTGGKLFQWNWLDPSMGIVGAVIVSTWAYSLLRDTSRVLLDREMDHAIVQEIRSSIEADGETKITDLHLTRVGRQQFACVVSVVTALPRPAFEYKERLKQHEELVHVTVEVLRCEA